MPAAVKPLYAALDERAAQQRVLHREGCRRPGPGRAERRDHGVRLRADRGASPRLVGDHRAVGDAPPVGRSLHCRAGHHRANRSAQHHCERRSGSLSRLLSVLQPISLAALLSTLVLLFGFQGEQILAQPFIIAILAVPILIQVYFNSGLAYLLNRATGEAHCVAGPSALIGASNFFELAVAAAISLFGFNSGAALATVVGVLIEVPVMLSVVKIVNSSRGWYEAGAAVRRQKTLNIAAEGPR